MSRSPEYGPATPEATTTTRTRGTMFSAMRVRNYRLFTMGQLVSNTGTWMQRTAQDWLVLSITDSPAAVGITTAMQFLPLLLFGLFGGVIADRYPKRRLLLATQSSAGVLAGALAVLTLSGNVEVWHVYLIAFLLGLVTVVDNPTRQTFVTEMVGHSMLRNAVSLNSANFQAARLIGPAVAGVMISAIGTGWAFGLNAVSYAAVLCGLVMMRTKELYPVPPVPRERGQLREGLRYVAGKPELIWPIVLVGFVGTFGYNFPIVLSAFTKQTFHQGAGMYGLVNTLMAVGSLVGALLAARRARSRLRMLVVAAGLFGVMEMIAALSPWFWLFGLLLVLVGTVAITFNTTANATVQLASAPEMRGRVMSLYMLVFAGGTPIGAPIIGWITDQWGPRAGLLVGGVVSAAVALLVGLVLARVGGLRLRVGRPGGEAGFFRLVPARAPAEVVAAAAPTPERFDAVR